MVGTYEDQEEEGKAPTNPIRSKPYHRSNHGSEFLKEI